MRTLHVFTAVLGLFALACDKGETKNNEEQEAAAPKSTAAEGPVTMERLKGFDQGKVNQYAMDFPKCLAAAEEQLGKVNKVDGKEHWWAVVDGDDCHAYILYSNDAKTEMARAKGPYKVFKSELETCKAIAGG